MESNIDVVFIACFSALAIAFVAVLVCGFLDIDEALDNRELCGNGEVHKTYETKLICKAESVIGGELIESYYEVEK